MEETTDSFNQQAANSIINFLKTNVPKNEVQKIDSELKTELVFAKKRSKQQKRKPIKKKTRCLTRKEKKTLRFYNIPRHSVKYEDVVQMNKIWLEYITEVLAMDDGVPEPNSKNWETLTLSLYKADYHGCMLTVVRSKCPSFINKTGICIMDTKNTFKIVSKDNIVTTIPKKECVFELYLKKFKVTLFGKLLCAKPAERSTKKVKGHLHPDL